jgi:hypothetical protein
MQIAAVHHPKSPPCIQTTRPLTSPSRPASGWTRNDSSRSVHRYQWDGSAVRSWADRRTGLTSPPGPQRLSSTLPMKQTNEVETRSCEIGKYHPNHFAFASHFPALLFAGGWRARSASRGEAVWRWSLPGGAGLCGRQQRGTRRQPNSVPTSLARLNCGCHVCKTVCRPRHSQIFASNFHFPDSRDPAGWVGIGVKKFLSPRMAWRSGELAWAASQFSVRLVVCRPTAGWSVLCLVSVLALRSCKLAGRPLQV